MKTKNLFMLFFACAAVLSAASCKKEQAVKGFDVAKFSVQAVEVASTSATLKVSVTENSDATWYGFITDDITTPAATLVGKIAGIKASVLNSGDMTITKENLIPGGYTYRYIVTGAVADGRTYGDPVEVKFSTAANYTENASWAAQFVGTVLEKGEYVSYFQFAGMQAGEMFGYYVQDAESFTEQGAAASIAEDVQFVITNDIVDECINKKAGYYLYDALDPGNYYVVVYGVTEDYYPTEKYIAVPFTVEGASDAYESYLGTWYTEVGTPFAFGESMINESYAVAGFFSTNNVPVYFDPVTGQIEICAYKLGTASGYTYYLVGIDETLGAVVTGDANGLLATGKISADGKDIAVTGNKYTASGKEVSVDAITVARYGSKGWESVSGAAELPAPCVISSKEPQPSDKFKAWFGTWYDADGNKYEFAQDVVNKSLSITGFGADKKVYVDYDDESGMIAFYGQELDSDSKYTYYFIGIDQDDYLEFGDPDYGILAFGAMAADKTSFDVIGNEYQAVYSGTVYDEIISGLGIFGQSVSNNKYYNFRGTEGWQYPVLPNTFTKEPPIASDAYKAWIGSWDVTRVEEESHAATEDDVNAGLATEVGEKVVDEEAVIDTWTIEQKKVNSTYTLTGIEGTAFEVEALFDKATGAISVAEQSGIYELTDAADNNVLTIDLYGMFKYGSSLYYWGESNEPVLFTAVIGNDGKAQMTAGCPHPSLIADYGYFLAFRLYATMGADEKWMSYSYDATPLPNVMVPASAGTSAASLAMPVDAKEWTPATTGRCKEVNIPSLNDKKNKGNKDSFRGASAPKNGKQLKGEAPTETTGTITKKQASKKNVKHSTLRGLKEN